jgi:hypothetical protein
MMYLILTELRGRPADGYGDLEKTIKALGNWGRQVSGTWMLESDRFNASQIRDFLRPHVVPGVDRIFVARITKNWSGLNMSKSFPDWMKRRNFDAPARKDSDRQGGSEG